MLDFVLASSEVILAPPLTIVSKDVDFRHWSFLFGFPPKVIWIRLGNCSTAQIEALLRRRRMEIDEFLADEEAALLGLA